MSPSEPSDGGAGAGSVPIRARGVALAALSDRAGNVTAHLNRLLAGGSLAPADAALARELAMGVTRRRRTLDAVIASFRQRRQRRAPVRLRQILRLGVYQLLFLQRVPDFAAVNEAVEQVGPGLAGLKGFVNAVLRGVARALSPPQFGRVPLEADVIPVGEGSFRRIDRTVFPDPRADPAGFLAQACSLSDELARKWLADLGGLDGAVPIALHANARPPLVLRVNALRATVAEVVSRLAGIGAEAAAHANGLSVVLRGHLDLLASEAFREGLVQPQDATATAIVATADVRPGMRVLDMCAAPGTKTTHLAERMHNRGEIVAVDVSAAKLARVQENCQRLGAVIVRTLPAEEVASLAESPFDMVLVDAPCSNTGVLARRAEARWRFSADNLRRLADDQKHLLLLGAQFVRPGGSLVYSTCSLEDEENGQIVRDCLRHEPAFRVVRQRRLVPAGADDPTRWSDGGFFAVLRRS